MTTYPIYLAADTRFVGTITGQAPYVLTTVRDGIGNVHYSNTNTPGGVSFIENAITPGLYEAVGVPWNTLWPLPVIAQYSISTYPAVSFALDVITSTGYEYPVAGITTTIVATLTLGPYTSLPNRLPYNPTVAGITVDLYAGDAVVPAVGAGTYTGTTRSAGTVTFNFNQSIDSSGYLARATYPAGAWDPTQPLYQYTRIDRLF
jgi:hypothetical protein